MLTLPPLLLPSLAGIFRWDVGHKVVLHIILVSVTREFDSCIVITLAPQDVSHPVE